MKKLYEHTAYSKLPEDIMEQYGNYKYYLTSVEDGYAVLTNEDTDTGVLVEVLDTSFIGTYETLGTLKNDWFVLHQY